MQGIFTLSQSISFRVSRKVAEDNGARNLSNRRETGALLLQERVHSATKVAAWKHPEQDR
jgi:hypothetical protein